MKRSSVYLILLFPSIACGQTQPESINIDQTMHHIRSDVDAPQEWTSFPESASESEYRATFHGTENATEFSLQLVQQDVKQNWDIKVNDTRLGRLLRDENEIVGLWAIPAGTLIDGENKLIISTTSKTTDDIRIGKAVIFRSTMTKVLNQARVRINVTDESTGMATPCRITVISNDGLITIGANSNDHMAVRPGVIYCKGRADFGLPIGTFQIFAGRGPEYSIATHKVNTIPGGNYVVDLSIRREVDTAGYIACDTHVHTLTHSGHGDSTVQERMLTLAGEAIELPIATDHNKHIDYEDVAIELDVRRFFTPVIGNEVTTKLGHFNVFPVRSADTPIPDYKTADWEATFNSIFATDGVKVAILNHARDIHSKYRPFGPEHHLAATGNNLDGWTLRANAMEVINSAAQQSDVMRLVHDWMGLLNAGLQITPVGCSDSHDVARHFVGQGRTYIRCDDTDAGKIEVSAAVEAFTAGKVNISCGLMATATVNESFEAGDLVPQSKSYQMHVSAIGASWTQASEIEVFVNGASVQTYPIASQHQLKAGLKHRVSLQLPVSKHQDVFVTAVVRGPGVTELYWPIAKPYQPTTPEWTPMLMAITGSMRIDADGDGRFTCAKDYAHKLRSSATDLQGLVERLKQFDAAVALHAAAIVMEESEEKYVRTFLPLARATAPHVGQAFEMFFDEWQASKRAAAIPDIGSR